MWVVESAGLSDVGRKRKGNEDSMYLDDELRIYVVADGMGGRNAGEVASKLTVETIRDYLKGLRGDLESELLGQDPKSLSRDGRRLVTAVNLANREVFTLSSTQPDVQGMGTTVSAALIVNNKFVVTNVGDSPIYAVRNNGIRMISIPHTMMAEHLATAAKGAKPLGEQYRHVLTRAVGINATVQPDTREYRSEKGDVLILCSDGLSDKVRPEEILERVNGQAPQAACRALVDLANARGGEDNITVIVLKILEDKPLFKPPPPPATEKPAWVECQIPMDYDTDDASYRGKITRVGPAVLYIEAQRAFSEGETLSMMFKPGESEKPALFSGQVVERDPRGVKVKFDPLSPDQKKTLHKLLARLGWSEA